MIKPKGEEPAQFSDAELAAEVGVPETRIARLPPEERAAWERHVRTVDAITGRRRPQ